MRLKHRANASEHLDTKIVTRPIMFLALVLIMIAGLASYANSFKGAFLWDDDFLVKENTFTHSISASHIKSIFATTIGAGAGREFLPYRPLQIVAYMGIGALCGIEVWGYHALSVFFHLGVALLIFWLVIILFKDSIAAFISGLFFAVHPVHTEAVSYISGLADPLSVFFMLGALIAYVKIGEERSIAIFVIMALSFALALLSREMALVFPLLILLYHGTFKRKTNLAAISAMIVIAVLYLVLRQAVLQGMPVAKTHTGAIERLPGFFVALTAYLKILFVPTDLHIGYGDRLFRFSHPAALTGALIVGALVWALIRTKKSGNRIAFFALGWFIITLLPQSNIYPVGAYMSDHWLYIPSIGAFLLAASYASSYIRRSGTRAVIAILLILIYTCIFTVLTARQNAVYWRDPMRFYNMTLRYAPYNVKLYNNMANLYYASGRKEEALSLYRRAIQMAPRSWIAQYNIGNIYLETGLVTEAAAAYRKVLEVRPDFVPAREGLERATEAQAQ